MQTLEKFLAGSDVSMRCREVTPNGGDNSAVPDPWAAKHYACELHGSNGDRPVRTVVGSDNGPPEMVEVLDTLAAEAAVTEEARGFEAWAAQMGYDPDSRHAERTYRADLRRAKLLRQLLGEQSYQRLLWEIDRL
jgi:hypothetical protein